MPIVPEQNRLVGIAQILVQEQLLDKAKALEYQTLATANRLNLLQFLVANSVLSPKKIATTVSAGFGLPLLDLESINFEQIPASLVSEKLIKRHAIAPIFKRGNYLYLATDDPSKQAAFNEIQFHTGLHPIAVVVETDKLTDLIDKILTEKSNIGLSDFVDGQTGYEGIDIIGDEDPELNASPSASDDAPIVKFVNKIILEGIQKGVSDIHFEPYEQDYRIRYRLDGILMPVTAPPVALAGRITARIKVMSNLDISERRVPQDGRFKIKLSRARAIDFRVSSCPTVGGEKIVMRILDPSSTKLGIEVLGLNPKQEALFTEALNKPQGMILVTGPTGSGKTISLYSGLNILNTKENSILTVEDPVEIKIQGINQVNINLKAGLGFPNALRSFLRQDPDIIMVGEIRDLETAEIAIKAAQTGHLVLSTLHTNSAAETLTRLVNMGVPSFNIASSVTLLVAQRLARMLCENCKKPRDDFTPKSLIELGFAPEESETIQLFKAVGCKYCTQGYKGRTGIFEVLPMSNAIGRLIMSGANSLDILKQAQSEGMMSIYQSGLEKVKNGVTTIEEVNRVTVE